MGILPLYTSAFHVRWKHEGRKRVHDGEAIIDGPGEWNAGMRHQERCPISRWPTGSAMSVVNHGRGEDNASYMTVGQLPLLARQAGSSSWGRDVREQQPVSGGAYGSSPLLGRPHRLGS